MPSDHDKYGEFPKSQNAYQHHNNSYSQVYSDEQTIHTEGTVTIDGRTVSTAHSNVNTAHDAVSLRSRGGGASVVSAGDLGRGGNRAPEGGWCQLQPQP